MFTCPETADGKDTLDKSKLLISCETYVLLYIVLIQINIINQSIKWKCCTLMKFWIHQALEQIRHISPVWGSAFKFNTNAVCGQLVADTSSSSAARCASSPLWCGLFAYWLNSSSAVFTAHGLTHSTDAAKLDWSLIIQMKSINYCITAVTNACNLLCCWCYLN